MMPTRWLELSVRIPADEFKDDLVEALVALGATAIQEEAGTLITYVAPPEDPERFVRDAVRRLEAHTGARPVHVAWRWRKHEDWTRLWRQGLRPRRVGRHFVVAPSWTAPELRPDDIVITVDPEMAFGTGEHATTRGALRLLEEAIRAGDRVLDVGTGTGILAIAAVKRGAAEVLAVEKDPVALENARKNVARNDVVEPVELVNTAVDEAFLARLGAGRFTLILANVLSSVLTPLLPAFRTALAPGGRLILGGILDYEAEEVIDAARAASFRLRIEDLEDDWWSALFERASRFG